MFGVSLGMTLLIEGILALILGITKKDITVVLLINTVTNILAVLVSWLAGRADEQLGIIVMFIMEGFAVAVEGYAYKTFNIKAEHLTKDPWLLSLFMNEVSFAIGACIWTPV